MQVLPISVQRFLTSASDWHVLSSCKHRPIHFPYALVGLEVGFLAAANVMGMVYHLCHCEIRYSQVPLPNCTSSARGMHPSRRIQMLDPFRILTGWMVAKEVSKDEEPSNVFT